MHPTNYLNASASSSKLESLRVSKTEEEEVVDEIEVVAFRRHHGGTPELIYAKKSNNPAPQSILAMARAISDINAVCYPEGVSSPNPMLNQHAKDGKFRCVSVLDLFAGLGFMI